MAAGISTPDFLEGGAVRETSKKSSPAIASLHIDKTPILPEYFPKNPLEAVKLF